MMDSITCVNSIFEQPWWLEAMAPGQWDSVEIEKNGKVVARLPFVKQKRLRCNLLGLPDFTQTLGYWIDDTDAKNPNKFTRRKDLITELIEKLPKNYNVDIALDHSCDYLFPFVWNGFRIQLAYSYRIEDIHDVDQIWSEFADKARRGIRKAQKILTVEDNHSIDDLITLRNKTFARQGRKLYDYSIALKRLDAALLEKNARKLFCAVDSEGRIHAATYFVYDDKCCYAIVGGEDPELRSSNAASLLIWEGIKFASTTSKSFDFEGSMIEPIEMFFRAFGGVPTPYWRVTKLNPLLSFADYLKPLKCINF